MRRATNLRAGAAIAALLALPLHATLAWAGDPYEDAFARAGELEREQHPGEAARLLERVAALYPQDYAVALAIGRLRALAGQDEAASRAYEVALQRSPGGLDARVGLGLALARLGRCDAAYPHLRAVAAQRPDLPEPRAALAGCAPRPTWVFTPGLALTGQLFPNHPTRAFAAGGSLDLGMEHRSGWFLGTTYRFSHFVPPSSPAPPFPPPRSPLPPSPSLSPLGALSPFDQYEGYLRAGYAAKGFGVGFTYGFVEDGSGALGASDHIGFLGRVSPFGDIELEASASFYRDMAVLRASSSWRIPMAFGLSARPRAAVQWAGGELHATGSLTLALDRAWGGLFVGGKYGEEVRPAYLSLPLVYDIEERIPYGLWAGGSLNVRDGLRIHLSYAMDRMRWSSGAGTAETSAHALTLGADVSF